jgi:hypothetical protein
MGKLTMGQRKKLKKSQFAIPSKAPGSGSYPITDRSHAANALARVSEYGTPEEKAQVRSKVKSKYPDMG